MGRILGVPLDHFILALAITTIISIVIFLMPISEFGTALLGAEDIHLFLWIFWHFEKSLDSIQSPFFADEIFYPEGVSLTLLPMFPFQSLIYWALPDWIGPFGKLTLLQVLSFILGGIFSFSLVHRFTKSFFPSLAGMIVFNFSVYHFEKAIHHLNYSMAFPFLALFFIYYFDAVEGKKQNHIPLAISLLLIALNELTVAIMAGFIVFLDIFQRYLGGERIFTTRNTLIFALSIISSLMAYEFLAWISAPAFLTYTVPSLFFLSASLLLILKKDRLIESERRFGHFRSMAIAAVPVLLYISFLAILPSYAFQPDSILVNTVLFSVPVEYLIIPSGFQSISGFFDGLSPMSEGGVYIGVAVLILLVFAKTKEERYFRNLSLLAVLFSFPVIRLGESIIFATPFLAEPLFPLLPVLRVPPRFMLFAFLFLSIMAGLVAKRLLSSRKQLLLLLLLVLIAERWPANGNFIFDASIPGFYSDLADDPPGKTIFLYPNFDYNTLLREQYYQTIHHKRISYGILSRLPVDSGLVRAYREDLYGLMRSYDYVVVQKLACKGYCFNGELHPISIANATHALDEKLGAPIFEDGSIIVYRASK